MKRGKIISSFIFVILISLSVFCVQVSIEKREILAVDELHITSSSPDILKINNGLFILEVLPNRGRIIWRIYPVSKKEDMIYFSEDPYILPFMDEITSQYFFELGGFYLSVPWNPRSNQPYPYEKYDIIQSNDKARIILEGINPIKKIKSRVELVVESNNPKIFINVVLQNLSKSRINVSVKEFTNFDISTGSIITDFSNLDGKRLEDFNEYKLVSISNLKFFGIVKEGHSFRKILGSDYSKHHLQIWGKNWEEYIGGAPMIRLIDERSEKVLAPGEELHFTILFEYVKAGKDD